MIYDKVAGAVHAGVRGYAKHHYGEAGAEVADYLLKPEKKGSIATPAQMVKATKLGRYLDRRYARKCGVEIKTHDVSATNTAVTGTLTSGLGNIGAGIAQGLTAIDNRVGYGFEIKKLVCNIDLYAGAGSTSATNVRMVIIHHKQMQNAALTGANILAAPTDIRSPYILSENQIRDFTILKDVTFTLSSLTSGESVSFKKIRWTYKPKGCHRVAFTAADTTGAIANMDEGAIYVMFMYSGATAPTFDYYYRLSYIDE